MGPASPWAPRFSPVQTRAQREQRQPLLRRSRLTAALFVTLRYTAGRDGAICSWDLGVDVSDGPSNDLLPRPPPPPSTFRSQIQLHTHWVNDIALCDSNQALVSCSSDLTVKVWRPHSNEQQADTIGLHSDYVKCLAASDGQANWVASGGLDRKIKFWDLNGQGKTLEIDVGDNGDNPKGSIYSLGTGGGILASGGPESVVRLWDPRSGQSITKFVGHTDNVRSILVSDDGSMVLTASSDTTIKLWSVKAARCLHTLSMHNDSVWSLHSSHPGLEVFHSSDRSGLVAKTDVRNVAEIADGTCVAVCQENEGVNKVVASGDYIWTTTSSSSINRWLDVDTENALELDTRRPRLASSASSRPRGLPAAPISPRSRRGPPVPVQSLLRLSSSSSFPANVRDPDSVTVYSVASHRQPSFVDTLIDEDCDVTVPVQDVPDETIQGQHGLTKHFILNDRRKVLTVDTAGEVVMWDLIQCVATKSFGKRQLEDVAAEVNTVDTIANWCQVDTRTGHLACVLDENYCFDAEMYPDEAGLENDIEFKDDQRSRPNKLDGRGINADRFSTVNLGKWVLRYLFSNLIDQEIKRDEAYRKNLEKESQSKGQTTNGNNLQITLPPQLHIPEANGGLSPGSVATPLARPGNAGYSLFPATPGLAIGLATPALLNPTSPAISAEEGVPRVSFERANIDYFSAPSTAVGKPELAESTEEPVATPSTADKEKAEKAEKDKETFMSKWRSFGNKKLGRSASTDMSAKAQVDDKPSELAVTEEILEPDLTEGTMAFVLKNLRASYEVQLRQGGVEAIETAIIPSLPNETPVLKPPHNTTIIIQEDKPEAGGLADLYRGTVGCVGEDADQLEKVAPAWLGELLLLNRTPYKEVGKVSFILLPWEDQLPVLPTDSGS